MNKTIHQLEELTQAEQTDELAIFDVSAGDTKKISKANLQKKGLFHRRKNCRLLD